MIEMYDFAAFNDDRGSLIAWESNKNIPFEIKRVYCIYGVKDHKRRGLHAHKEGDIILICIKGTCKILINDGVYSTETLLDGANKGLHIPSGRWHEMYDFSQDAILLVLASNQYDEDDYIRDINTFLTDFGHKE